MSRADDRRELLQFLETIRRPDRPLDRVEDADNLVEAGLIDSLALLEIVAHLEERFGIDFRERGVDPDELRTIGGILALIADEAA